MNARFLCSLSVESFVRKVASYDHFILLSEFGQPSAKSLVLVAIVAVRVVVVIIKDEIFSSSSFHHHLQLL